MLENRSGLAEMAVDKINIVTFAKAAWTMKYLERLVTIRNSYPLEAFKTSLLSCAVPARSLHTSIFAPLAQTKRLWQKLPEIAKINRQTLLYWHERLN